ncbi:AAA family ATPase [Streptomyces microflavus]|uniref:AAA family ATPase n=1 Tax=Streptomyces microflavus TaxID=1919 RepID=UPI003821389D
MDAVWPDRLGVGDRVRLDGREHTVTGVYGRCLTLTDAVGSERHADVVTLLRSRGFSVPDQAARAPGAGPPRPAGDAAERARWWLPHIVEILTGLPPGAPPGTRPRPDFDPARRTLGEREEAKSEELRRAGLRGTSARTVRRKRARYEAEGLDGLADGRAGRNGGLGARWDPRILEAMRQVVSELAGERPGVESVRRRVTRLLAAEVRSGKLVLPSRTTFHRLYAELDAAGLIVGPDRWPGRQVVVDAVRLPPLPLPGGGQRELELVFALDIDTEVLLTAVVREGSRPVDGAALLARIWMPADRRADWLAGHGIAVPDSLSAEKSLPPLVRPQTLLLDRAAPLPRLADACRRHGVLVRAAPGALPYPRHHAEFVARQLAGMFSACLRSMRGDQARDAGWPVDMVQGLLDAWAQEEWNSGELHRQQGEFAVPQSPRSRALRYAVLTARAGWVATPPSPEAFAGLLPGARRRVTASGLYVNGRRFDSPALDAVRRRHPIEVRRDPYDTRHVWARAAEDWTAVPAAVPAPLLPLDRIPIRSPASSTGGHPVVARVQEVGSGRTPTVEAPDSSRIEYHAGLPLHTPDVEAVIRRAEELVLLNEHTSGARPGLVVSGESGTGKTTALLVFGRSYTARARLPAGSTRLPAVYVRVPPATTPRMFLAELARQASAPVRERAGAAELAREVSDALNRLGTGLVLVDEFEYLNAARGSSTPLFDTVDYLCDRVPATFVFAGRAAAMPCLAPSRRLLHLALGPMPHDRAWRDHLARTEAALLLRRHAPGSLPDMADHLHQLTGGRADRLGYLLRSGAIRAIRDGTEHLSRALLDDLASPWHNSRR